MFPRLLFLLCFILPAAATWAQPPPQKMVPPPGKEIPEKDRAALTAGAAELEKEIDALRSVAKAARLLPDVVIFHKAVDWALRYDEFMDAKHVAVARDLLAEGRKRAQALKAGQAPWTTQTGLVVRGYQSRIDDSIQPYGLVVPAQWSPEQSRARRLDIWNHGRSDTLTELAFLRERMTKQGEFAPPDAFVLHPYGRFCNATKFAGESDVFEAMAAVRAQYPIDPDRILMRGFSMGGASTWHLGVHHASLWCAINPGAGFAETAQYAGVFRAGKTPPPWWEQVLWRWYDADLKARNLFNVPVVAYSGELDKQKAAADRMADAARREGISIEHIIGPKTEHKFEPGAKRTISEKLDAHALRGRVHAPPKVRFVAYTLRYPKMHWVELDALDQQWERAEVDAELVDEGTIRLVTKNIAALTLRLDCDPLPLDPTRPPRIVIDSSELTGPAVKRPWVASFHKQDGTWRSGALPAGNTPRKRSGLTGPIDDAFTGRFIFVRPTGRPFHATIEKWARDELDRAIAQWRLVFRGDAIVKDDREISAEDIQGAHLVLWGDPGSNLLLAKLLPKLPLEWTASQLALGPHRVAAAHHLPAMIYPNPLNPSRYVVLNSSFTFRMGSRTSNSLQTPKLPDWAIFDLRTRPDDERPGSVFDAGFFDEHWRPR